jgi:hypothetical protein
MIQDKFRHFELENSLFDIHVDNIPIWERIRVDIYRELRRQFEADNEHDSESKEKNNYIMGAKLWARNICFKNPFVPSKTDFVFVGHPRRKLQSDGLWWDIYCDPIHQECSLDSVHLEPSYLLKHRSPAKTENIRYLSLIEYSGTIQRKLGLDNFSLSDEKRKRLEEVERAIKKNFGADIPFVNKVIRLLRNRRCRLWLYEKLLGRLDPTVAVIVVSYGKETFIEACDSHNIPVVELQHGIINSGHHGYSFPGNRTKETFPDYLLTWGEFWGDGVEFPIPDRRIIPVGYPHLEKQRLQWEDTESQEQILFISQKRIGEQLSRFAVEIEKNDEISHDVIYKLHPDEHDHWREDYPWLVKNNLDVVDEHGPPLYELLARSEVQIGVGSTAIYEGLVFNLETYIYDCNDLSSLRPLIRNGTAVVVSSSNELATSLGKKRISFDKEYYFKSNSAQRICEVLNRISEVPETGGRIS